MASASMTMTLAELATNLSRELNPLTMSVVRETLYHNTFAAALPVKAINGIVNGPYRRESTNVLVKNSQIGDQISEGYATFTSVTDTAGTLIVQIPMNVKVQTAHTIEDPWAVQMENAGIELALALDNLIINGPGTNEGTFLGIRGLANAAGATQQLEVSDTTAGGEVTLLTMRKLANCIKGRKVDYYLTDTGVVNDLYALGMAMGGNTWQMTMQPYAYVGPGGYLTIGERAIPAFGGVPIYESDWMGTETTFGGAGKHRIIAGSFGSDGIKGFYPSSIRAGRQGTVLGLSFDPMRTKETVDEDYIRGRWYFGMELRAQKAIAQAVNIKLKN
jgi:hypothetical protein